jgi:hypothetical protein
MMDWLLARSVSAAPPRAALWPPAAGAIAADRGALADDDEADGAAAEHPAASRPAVAASRMLVMRVNLAAPTVMPVGREGRAAWFRRTGHMFTT